MQSLFAIYYFCHPVKTWLSHGWPFVMLALQMTMDYRVAWLSLRMETSSIIKKHTERSIQCKWMIYPLTDILHEHLYNLSLIYWRLFFFSPLVLHDGGRFVRKSLHQKKRKIQTVRDSLTAFLCTGSDSCNRAALEGRARYNCAIFSTADCLKYEWAASLYIMLADMSY